MLFPRFWFKPKVKTSVISYFLFPLSFLWMVLGNLKLFISAPSKSPIPIICVGNITVGGNGKTPTALKLCSLLKDRGYHPHILSRGYKGNLKGPHLVNPLRDSFIDVGDEALMMSKYHPTWISRNRESGVKSAITSGANVIILDDGFQNYHVKKDFSILVIEASVGFGNGYLIPAGPLRETISSGLKKTDLIIIIGEHFDQTAFERDTFLRKNIPIVEAKIVAKINKVTLNQKTVIGFAGIAHPEKFRNTLETLGANVINFKAFTNHKPFKLAHLKELITEAKKKHALLVTTEKDLVRIPEKLQPHFKALKVEVEIKNQNLLLEKLMPIL